MKNMTIFRLIMVTLLTISVQQAHCARVAGVKAVQVPMATVEAPVTAVVSVDQQKDLAKTFVETELIVKNAIDAMGNARELLLGANNEDAQQVKTIIEHNNAKVMAEQKLAKMRDTLAEKVEANIAPEGYMSRLVAGAKNIGSGIAAYFTAGTGTPEEKETAKLIVKGLTEQELKITEKYALMQKGLAPAQQAQLKNRYDAIIAQFEVAIYEQQIITGDTRMGMIKRGLLLGAAAAGTAAIGVMLTNKYFGESTATGPTEPELEKGMMEQPPISGSSNVQPNITMPVQNGGPAGTGPQPITGSEMGGTPRETTLEDIKAGVTAGMRESGRNAPKEMWKDIKAIPGKVYKYVGGSEITEFVSPYFEKGKEAINKEFAARTSMPISDAVEEGKKLAAQKFEEGKELAARKFEELKAAATREPKEGEAPFGSTYAPAAVEFMKEKAGQVSDYLNAPGQPAQEPGDIEGFTLEESPRTSQAIDYAAERLKEANEAINPSQTEIFERPALTETELQERAQNKEAAEQKSKKAIERSNKQKARNAELRKTSQQ